MSLPDFCKLSLQAKNTIPITAQCTVFAESEVISLVGEGKPMDAVSYTHLAVCFYMAEWVFLDIYAYNRWCYECRCA